MKSIFQHPGKLESNAHTQSEAEGELHANRKELPETSMVEEPQLHGQEQVSNQNSIADSRSFLTKCPMKPFTPSEIQQFPTTIRATPTAWLVP